VISYWFWVSAHVYLYSHITPDASNLCNRGHGHRRVLCGFHVAVAVLCAHPSSIGCHSNRAGFVASLYDHNLLHLCAFQECDTIAKKRVNLHSSGDVFSVIVDVLKLIPASEGNYPNFCWHGFVSERCLCVSSSKNTRHRQRNLGKTLSSIPCSGPCTVHQTALVP
jgi:hypothetical protein